MAGKTMTRVTARQIAVQMLFSMEANALSAEDTFELFFSEAHYDSLMDEDEIYREKPDEEQTAYIRRILLLAEEHIPEIDEIISQYASGWKLNRISRSTLAVLRCALCEILYMEDIPNSAAVNEAVEIGKKYDSPKSAAFINGVLGSFLRDRQPNSSCERQSEAVHGTEGEAKPTPDQG